MYCKGIDNKNYSKFNITGKCYVIKNDTVSENVLDSVIGYGDGRAIVLEALGLFGGGRVTADDRLERGVLRLSGGVTDRLELGVLRLSGRVTADDRLEPGVLRLSGGVTDRLELGVLRLSD